MRARLLPLVFVVLCLECITSHELLGQDGTVVAEIPQRPLVTTLDFSADGSYLGVGGSFGFHIYEMEEGQYLHRIDAGFIQALAFSPSDRNEFATWGDDNTIRLWRVGAREPRHKMTAMRGSYQRLLFFPSGEQLVSSATIASEDASGKSWNGLVSIWDSKDGNVKKTLLYEKRVISSVAVSNDGEFLAVASQHPPADVTIYDCGNWTRKWQIAIPDGYPNTVMFLGDHETVLIAGGKFDKNSHPQRDGRMWLAELNGDEYSIELLTNEGTDSFSEASTTPDSKRVVVGTAQIRAVGPYEDAVIARFELRNAHTARSLFDFSSVFGSYLSL